MNAGDPIGRFAADVGPVEAGAVHCRGGSTQWDLGGEPEAGVREVAAPAGVVSHEPGEMIVRVRAATTIAELDAAVSGAGQMVSLEADRPGDATVGGVLACGRSGVRRLGRGPVRDCVLEVTAVSAEGRVVRAGAPLVKNVTGYDLCRLLVGSHGTLAFIAEVVLRCQPRPPVESWWRCEGADPFELCRRLYRPLAVLWDGTTTWVGVSGHRADVDAQAAKVLRTGDGAAVPVEGPPGPPGRIRRSLSPADLGALPRGGAAGSAGRWLAEIGVGIVHCDEDAAASVRAQHAGPEVVELHRRLKEGFDPTGRLNPGRSPLAAASAGVGS